MMLLDTLFLTNKVETPIRLDAFFWRPAPDMFTVEQAVGELIAWPVNKCVILEERPHTEDISLRSPRTDSANKCKLLAWSVNSEVIAEGRWQSQEPKALVNGLPLGPNAVKVFVDEVFAPQTFLWRPTTEMIYLVDSLMSFVAWPADRVVFEKPGDATSSRSPLQDPTASDQPHSSKSPAVRTNSSTTGSKSPQQSSPDSNTKSSQKKSPATSSKSPLESSPEKGPKSNAKKAQPLSLSPLRRSQRNNQDEVIKENRKCKLMSISGKRQVVAEGRWSSDNPDQTVHFVPLGPNAVRVWVDIVKVNSAAVWRPSSEIECMQDAIGTSIAWPKDKVILC